MKLKILIIAILLLTLGLSGFSQSVNFASNSIYLPPNSISIVDDVTSMFINPAGLGTYFDLGFGLFVNNYGTDGVNNLGFLTKFGPGALGVEYFRPNLNLEEDYFRISIANGMNFNNVFLMGSSFSYTLSSYEKYNKFLTFKTGILLRPVWVMSFGATLTNFHKIIKEDWQNIQTGFSLGFKPGIEFVTLSSDFNFDWNFDNYDISGLLKVEAPAGFNYSIGVNYDFVNENLSLIAGLSFSFGIMNIGYGSKIDPDDAKYFQGTTSVIMSSKWDQNVILKPKGYLEIPFSGILSEKSMGGSFGGNFSLLKMIKLIRTAKDDKNIKGIILNFSSMSNFSNAGLAQIQEIRKELINFKKTGKEIISYLKRGSMKSYYLASISDEIYMPEVSTLFITGISMTKLYYKDFLEKIGVEAIPVRFEEYKTAFESFTNSEMTEANKEMQTSLMNDMYNQIVSDLSKELGKSKNDIELLINKAPYTSKEALKLKIIDGLINYQDLKLELAKNKKMPVVSPSFYRYANSKDTRWASRPKIAILNITGNIVEGFSFPGGMFGGDSTGDESTKTIIKSLMFNPQIKGVILRVNSGGGSALASDQIWHAVKKLAEVKPVVASFGNIAGSGGYYIALPSAKIYADESTLTGSIGVFGLFVYFNGLLEKLGINATSLSYGENSDLGNPFFPPKEEDKQILERLMKEIYDTFITRVATSRDMSEEKVKSIAKGRVYTGNQAKEIGLIDEIGGLYDAIDFLADSLELKPNEYDIVSYPKQWFFELIMRMSGMFAKDIGTNFINLLKENENIIEYLKNMISYLDSKYFMAIPYQIYIK